MDSATTLAIIILIIALIILIYYYLQSINHPVYQNINKQASDLSSRIAKEEYVANFSNRVNDLTHKDKDQKDDDKDHVSKTDIISKKIDQFINEQSEQVINDWNLVTHKDLDDVISKFDLLEDDLDNYKKSNDSRVKTLEEKVETINQNLKDVKIDELLDEYKVNEEIKDIKNESSKKDSTNKIDDETTKSE